MNKDVIYIDVEDDITAIIGKVKDAKEKIVALVPPKRIGVLQSAVNLRLLARAAGQNDKRLVLISNNSALLALASAAKIPVAKNLQSKPELAEIPALDVDDGEDVIDGASLPVGELAKTADRPAAAASIADMDIDDVMKGSDKPLAKAAPPAAGQLPPKPRSKNGPKVPNFNKFRKKMVLIIGGGVLLLAFLIWAIFFAPRATVVITARTTDSSMNASVSLIDQAATKLSSATIKTVSKTMKKDASVSFDATGTKDVGEKAKGQVYFENCETPTAQSIPAGTAITANGQNYVTLETASVPGGSGGFGGCSSPGRSAAVGIQASDIGDSYNTPSGTRFSVSGHANNSSVQYFRATASSEISGGSKKQVKVVTDADIQQAVDKLKSQGGEEAKKQLAEQFDDDVAVLDQTFKADQSGVKPEPAVGAEAPDGKAKLTGSITYVMAGADRDEIARYLDEYFKKRLEGKDDQRVYEDGAKKATLTDIKASDDGFTANLTATAKIGPKINDDEIKNVAKGKRYGEIQSSIEEISGVEDVDIKYWPFWVSVTPDDTSRISVEFKLNESK
ncbi:MAG TPA: hypothetical protein VFZ62_00830 [Candidatus Saccharimonadales bacterium]